MIARSGPLRHTGEAHDDAAGGHQPDAGGRRDERRDARSEGSALHAERRDRPHPADEDHVQRHIQADDPHADAHARARIARRPQRSLRS